MTPTGKDKSLDSQVIVRLSSDLRQRLEILAQQRGKRVLSDYIREVLEEHAVKMEGTVALDCGLCGHAWEVKLARGETQQFTCPKCKQATITLRVKPK